ncbi:MAG: sugar ABC transporter permease [Chloroflexota bacterium]|jgi:multiple sugar transport system permease protein|nr:carbohydrate ABC transporter permease [Caldilinea sp.]GIK75369.1 MAG: sugar ABC transporter permease [Chloroflexota bacterium]
MALKTYEKILIYLAWIAVLLFFLTPIAWFWALALRPQATAFAMPPVFFFQPHLDAFRYTFLDPGVNAPQLRNSLIVALGATLLNLPFAMAAAYALSRFRLRGKRFFMLWYLSLLMAPPVVYLIPYFILMSRLRLTGTYFSMVLILQTLTIPMSVWLLKSFIDEVPVELEEAAAVDGANWFVRLVKIALPLTLPGIVVTSMFAFVFSWNNVVFPLVLSNQRTMTLPVGTMNYFATAGITWNYIAATSVMAMIPPMIIFLLLGRYIVRGLTFGAVKG